MLDLNKISQLLPGIGEHLREEAAAAKKRMERAEALFLQARQRQDELVELQEKWLDRIWFSAATPVEPLDTRVLLKAPPKAHTVIATDGSQIAPNQHEIAYCYLINIGRVALHYNQNRQPLLDSIPEVVYRPEDLYVSRQWGIRTEEWMGYRRAVSEAQELAGLALEVRPKRRKTPVLAMVDGSLIYWFLESLPNEAIDRILSPILEAWDRMRLAGVPLMGYLSASRSSEALNFLRFQACPFDEPNCSTHCSYNPTEDVEGLPKRAPCQVIDPLRDAVFWGGHLQPGQRGCWWKSSIPILQRYGDRHWVYFCYVHVGTEIARIDVPAWVIDDPKQLDTALSLMLGQVHKGYGYPVTLAEAHNQAVVRGGDRHRFFSLLERQMIEAGLKNVGTSYKEARKRHSIA
ncbi:MAG: DNA double-strand break repair nuclease NurA [Cyanobacteria bacterium SID2]|nr:DNA double-strand break repair nuclease NurA [Cyanobacteria bacterium SID2]MBP0002378.1 DNA double-strand break repair nuclease NurA [Cyanobacteria bacterium SBC]